VTPAALIHELVEFDFVLRMAQAVKKFLEFALLLFEPAQGLGAVIVEGAVAARSRACAPPSAGVVLCRLLPPAGSAAGPVPQSPAADEIPQREQPERPP
jgi:hypothetical protein